MKTKENVKPFFWPKLGTVLNPTSGISILLPEDSRTDGFKVIIYPELKTRKIRMGKRTILVKPATRWNTNTYYTIYLKWTNPSGLTETNKYFFFCGL